MISHLQLSGKMIFYLFYEECLPSLFKSFCLSICMNRLFTKILFSQHRLRPVPHIFCQYLKREEYSSAMIIMKIFILNKENKYKSKNNRKPQATLPPIKRIKIQKRQAKSDFLLTSFTSYNSSKETIFH